MAEQNYQHHAHLPIPTFVAALFWLGALVFLGGAVFAGWDTRDLAVGALALSVFVLIAISRGYTVALQDRIILLEMKVRCAEVLPAGQDARLAQLTKQQIVGLRFASDAELGDLLDRAIREKLSQKDIKAAVKNWTPDRNRT